MISILGALCLNPGWSTRSFSESVLRRPTLMTRMIMLLLENEGLLEVSVFDMFLVSVVGLSSVLKVSEEKLNRGGSRLRCRVCLRSLLVRFHGARRVDVATLLRGLRALYQLIVRLLIVMLEMRGVVS